LVNFPSFGNVLCQEKSANPEQPEREEDKDEKDVKLIKIKKLFRAPLTSGI
jgi:hypothetical protein